MKHSTAPIRLVVYPAIAASVVIAIAALSLRDLGDTKAQFESPAPEKLQILKRPEPRAPEAKAARVPQLSESEALERIETGEALRAGVDRLWPEAKHRSRLLGLLLSETTPEEIRLHLLGLFRSVDPESALRGARTVLKTAELSQGPLRAASFEVLARHGKKEDLELLSKQPFELQQTTTLRETCRATLAKRLGLDG